MNVIEIEGLHKTLGSFALDIPELKIPEGYITGFIGENGAGKTTTIKLIMNMLNPNKGSITLFGKHYPQNLEEIKQQIGYVGEENGFFGIAPLAQLTKMIAPFFPSFDYSFYNSLIDRFGLDVKKQYKTLSRGMQKQFNLAVALAHHPRLLLMDEPTSNLDPTLRRQILELLQEEVAANGTTIFFSTHITSDLDKIGDYISFLHKGAPLLFAEKDTLLECHALVKGSSSLLNAQTSACLIGAESTPFGFVALTADKAQAKALFGQEAVLEKPTLEDIFIHYTKEV